MSSILLFFKYFVITLLVFDILLKTIFDSEHLIYLISRNHKGVKSQTILSHVNYQNYNGKTVHVKMSF